MTSGLRTVVSFALVIIGAYLLHEGLSRGAYIYTAAGGLSVLYAVFMQIHMLSVKFRRGLGRRQVDLPAEEEHMNGHSE